MREDMQNEIDRQDQHQCPLCKEILTDDYIEQNPFPEIPCSSCGSLMKISLNREEESALKNMRKEERCNISLKVSYKSFNRFIIDYTKNVSKGGMFIKTKSPHEIGSRLDVLLHVPNLDEPIRIMGRVVHNNFPPGKDEDAGIGIEFVDIEEKSREQLIKTLKAQKDCG
jgi:type IV pilus assembly protein PilZ